MCETFVFLILGYCTLSSE